MAKKKTTKKTKAKASKPKRPGVSASDRKSIADAAKAQLRALGFATAPRKLPKKPKLRAYPKPPNMGSDIEVWAAYEKRAKPIREANDKKIEKYEKAKKAFNIGKAAKSAIRDKIRSYRAG